MSKPSRLSISERVNPRLQKAFARTEEILERAQHRQSDLDKVGRLADQNYEANQALKREYVKLTSELQDLLQDLETLNLAHHLATSNLGQLASMLESLIYQFKEECEVNEGVRQEMAQVVTLLTNFKVFLNDPSELAALLREADPKTREAAMKLLDNKEN
jgi:hypothetical protein